MRLQRLSERIFWYPYEEERDRPILGYIRGDRYSVAVDAGHSSQHIAGFYDALKAEGLPLPELTLITHWHWDHTFAMPWVHGRTAAECRTDLILRELSARMDDAYAQSMKEQDVHIALEYAAGQEMKVCPADIVFHDRLELDCGGVTVQAFHGPSPHTADSTYVCIPEEKVLFLGDAACGVYPDWYVDPEKAQDMIAFLEKTDIRTALSGHWDPQTKEELIRFIAES